MELKFEEWCEVNADELTIIFAETGADREMDFNREVDELRLYENKNSYPNLKYYDK